MLRLVLRLGLSLLLGLLLRTEVDAGAWEGDGGGLAASEGGGEVGCESATLAGDVRAPKPTTRWGEAEIEILGGEVGSKGMGESGKGEEDKGRGDLGGTWVGERVRVRLEDESCEFGGKVTRDCSGARSGEGCESEI